MNPPINQLTHEVIGASIEVHRKLGPGLLESANKEMSVSGVNVERDSVRARTTLALGVQRDSAGMRLSRGHSGRRYCGSGSESG